MAHRMEGKARRGAGVEGGVEEWCGKGMWRSDVDEKCGRGMWTRDVDTVQRCECMLCELVCEMA